LTGINIYSNFFIFVNSSHPFQLTFDKKTRHQSACFLSLPEHASSSSKMLSSKFGSFGEQCQLQLREAVVGMQQWVYQLEPAGRSRRIVIFPVWLLRKN
jgi:hypothetical protein